MYGYIDYNGILIKKILNVPAMALDEIFLSVKTSSDILTCHKK